MSRHPGFRDAMYLVKHGVPYGTAMHLSPIERVVHCVVIGELNGGAFDWEAMQWMQKK